MENLTTRKQLFLRAAVIAALLGYLSPVFATDLAGVQQELDIHRQQWQLLEVGEYVYRFERECYCLPEFTTPGLVHVVDGTIASVRHLVTDQALDSVCYLTVDGLFDQVQLAISFGADELLVEYDGPLGYPTLIDIDFIAMAIDDEMLYRAGNLREVPEPPSVGLMIAGLVLLVGWQLKR